MSLAIGDQCLNEARSQSHLTIEELMIAFQVETGADCINMIDGQGMTARTMYLKDPWLHLTRTELFVS